MLNQTCLLCFWFGCWSPWSRGETLFARLILWPDGSPPAWWRADLSIYPWAGTQFGTREIPVNGHLGEVQGMETWINGIFKQPQAVETLLWCTVNQRANPLVFPLQMLTFIRCSIGSIKSNYFLYKPGSLEWSWTMVAVCWEHGGNVLGVHWECTESVLRVYWVCPGSVLGVCWESAGYSCDWFKFDSNIPNIVG